MADMTTPFEELLLAAPAPAPVTPPRPERETPVCPDAPVRPLPSSDEEDDEEDDGEEVPPPEEAEAEAEADPDNTYIPVRLFSKSPDMAELLAVARVLLEVDYRINGKVLLAAFVVLVAFLMLAVRR